MIYSVRYFSHYRRFKPFKLITDHKPLLAWRNTTVEHDITGRRSRWALEMSQYDMEVIYKEGRKHTDADALSRHPEPDECQKKVEREHLNFIGANRTESSINK
jgi:hypothetical protein